MRPGIWLLTLSILMFLAAFAFFLVPYVTEVPPNADYSMATLVCVVNGMLFGLSAFLAKARRKWRLSTGRALLFYAGLVLSVTALLLILIETVLLNEAFNWMVAAIFILAISGVSMMGLAKTGVRPDEPQPERRDGHGRVEGGKP